MNTKALSMMGRFELLVARCLTSVVVIIVAPIIGGIMLAVIVYEPGLVLLGLFAIPMVLPLTIPIAIGGCVLGFFTNQKSQLPFGKTLVWFVVYGMVWASGISAILVILKGWEEFTFAHSFASFAALQLCAYPLGKIWCVRTET